jgi:hypothetical protein
MVAVVVDADEPPVRGPPQEDLPVAVSIFIRNIARPRPAHQRRNVAALVADAAREVLDELALLQTAGSPARCSPDWEGRVHQPQLASQVSRLTGSGTARARISLA